jgi:hypothetical protein
LTIGPACVAVVLATAGAPARADIYALNGTIGFGPKMARFDNNGRHVQTVFAGVESVDGLAVTPDGYVYVTGNGLGSGVLDRAPVGGPFNWEAASPPLFKTPYNAPGGLEAGPDGSVYATSTAFYSDGVSGVFRYNPADGSFLPVVTLTDSNPGPGQVNFNRDVALAPGGDLYLLRDAGVERYNASTGQLVGLVIPRTNLNGTVEIDFGPDGNLYVPSPQGVDRFDPQTGALIDHFIPNGAGGLDGASTISFGGDGLLYVNDRGARGVLRYDAATGAFRDVFITPDQIQLVDRYFGLGHIAYAVPEPGAIGMIWGAVAVAALKRRRAGGTWPDGPLRPGM